jgi:hypothetical protein
LLALLFSRYSSITPALAEELEAAAAAVVKRVAVRQSRAALLPSFPFDSLACWALITGNLRPGTIGDATEGIEASFALRSDDPAPEMA